jgi:hypothetical protein
VVWFRPDGANTGLARNSDQPMAAMIAYVWGDRMVNLSVIDHAGKQWGITSVPLRQAEDYRIARHALLRVDSAYQLGLQAARPQRPAEASAKK